MVFSILLQIPIGLLLTTFLDAGGKKFNAFKTVCFFPYLMSSVAIAFLFNCILTAIGGLFSSLAQLITGKRTTVDLLGKNPQAMFAAIGVMAIAVLRRPAKADAVAEAAPSTPAGGEPRD